MAASGKKVLLTVHDGLSARIFFDCGIATMLEEALEGRLEIVSTFDIAEFADWSARVKTARIRTLQDLLSGRPRSTLRASWDAFLDQRIGFLPLAIRFNLRHGLHRERMEKGHSNGFLDSSRIGPLPRWDVCYRQMFRWMYGSSRYLHPALGRYLENEVSAVVSSHLQHQSTVPFILGAKRLGLPLVSYIASWDHLVGKGVVYPGAQCYIVQNEIMRNDLVRYHDIDPGRITVTGWPQTDIFSVRRPRSRYIELLASYGLDPAKPCVLVTGNSVTNAPYEPAFFKRLLEWWESGDGKDRFNLIFRPHPKDTEWQQRYSVLLERPRSGVYLQAPTYLDLEILALMLQHVECVVTNAGTILLDSLVNDRPAVSVLYDEGAPPGESHAMKNVIGEHYKEMLESRAFHRAMNFGDVARAIDACLEQPQELAAERAAVSRRIVGVVDGGAAKRVVGTIVASLRESLDGSAFSIPKRAPRALPKGALAANR